MHSTKSGEILDPMMVEKGQYELVKKADARGGPNVHVRWLQDHRCDEVRC